MTERVVTNHSFPPRTGRLLSTDAVERLLHKHSTTATHCPSIRPKQCHPTSFATAAPCPCSKPARTPPAHPHRELSTNRTSPGIAALRWRGVVQFRAVTRGKTASPSVAIHVYAGLAAQ